MKVSQDAVLQAAATIAAAKIQVGGAIAVASSPATASKLNIKAEKVLEESIVEVLAAIDSTEKNTSKSNLKTWRELGI